MGAHSVLSWFLLPSSPGSNPCSACLMVWDLLGALTEVGELTRGSSPSSAPRHHPPPPPQRIGLQAGPKMGRLWYRLGQSIAQLVKNPPAIQESPVQFLGREDPLEKG